MNTKKNKAFLLTPVGKDYIWGGQRLKKDFNKDFPLNPLAETWECSTHPNGPSKIVTGEFKGRILPEVLNEHPEFLGVHSKTKSGELPILIKFIDALNDLSVQVHPSDEYAFEHENGQMGKTEMWYVLDALPNSCIVYGLKESLSKEKLREAVAQGKLESYLNKVPAKKGDVFFIPSGTIHAIGKGCLMAEIQESSDLTYRLYDYDRVGLDGKKRPLHIDKALDVANLKPVSSPTQPEDKYEIIDGLSIKTLVDCKYFKTEKAILEKEGNILTSNDSFQVLLCYEGEGKITDEEGYSIFFKKGDCLFIPANSQLMKLTGNAEFLKVKC